MKRTCAGLLAAFALVIAPTAFANINTKAKFDKIDTNSDGAVSRDEFTTHAREYFVTCDTNHDGFCTVIEMKATEAGKSAKGMSAADKVKKFDSDGDGRLTVEEMTTGKQAMFDNMDKDKDGRLTAEEFNVTIR
jgi:Ca2+-binding EF-hand superfamily protein